MHKQNFIIIILFLTVTLVGQMDTLNKYGLNGKKVGYWKVYLDQKARMVKDINESYFFGFQYYIDGRNIGNNFEKRPKIKRCSYSGALPQKGTPTIIDGTFTSFDRHNRKYTEEKYVAGETIFLRSFVYQRVHSDQTGLLPKLSEDLDYTRKYNGQRFSYFFTFYHRSGTVYYQWFRDGEKGWKLYFVNADK